MNPQYKKLESVLQNHHKSLTAPRKLLFDQLLRGKPLAMRQLVYSVKNSVDRATVYRTIQLFEDIGVTHRLYIGWKYVIELAEDFQPHHHHILCQNCGKIVAIHSFDKLESAINEAARRESFRLVSHQVELQGICTDCEAPEYHKTPAVRR